MEDEAFSVLTFYSHFLEWETGWFYTINQSGFFFNDWLYPPITPTAYSTTCHGIWIIGIPIWRKPFYSISGGWEMAACSVMTVLEQCVICYFL